VAIIIAAMIAPEIKPNVQTVFFMEVGVGDGDTLAERPGFRVTLSYDFARMREKSFVQAINPDSFAI
jgi:hypothetical protein